MIFEQAYRLKLTTAEVPCTIYRDGSVIDSAIPATLEDRTDRVERDEVAEVRIRTTQPIAVYTGPILRALDVLCSSTNPTSWAAAS